MISILRFFCFRHSCPIVRLLTSSSMHNTDKAIHLYKNVMGGDVSEVEVR